MNPSSSSAAKPADTSTHLTEQHVAYLSARAVPIQWATNAGLRSVCGKTAATLLRRENALKCGALSVPYPNTNPTYVRLRLDSPLEGARYLCPEGVPVPLYVRDAHALKDGDPIVVVESPVKALALENAGFFAVGLGGVATTLDKKGNLNESWKRISVADRTVILLFDSNRASNPEVAWAEARLARALERAGASVRLAALPHTRNGEDWGPDDYLAAHGQTLMAKVLESAVPADPIEWLQTLTEKMEVIGLLDNLPFLLAIGFRGEATRNRAQLALESLGVSRSSFSRAIKAAEKSRRDSFKKHESGLGDHSHDGLPSIIVDEKQPREVLENAWSILRNSGESVSLYQFGSTLVSLDVDVTGALQARPVDEKRMHGLLIRVANWYASCKSGLAHREPPKYLASDMLVTPHQSLPVIRGLVRTPVLGSREIIVQPGYNKDDGIYLDLAKNIRLEAVPANPSDEQVAAAVNFLQTELFSDFPFADQASKANNLAALLLMFVRDAIRGPTPIHAFDAARAGAGKSKLAALLATIAGADPSFMTEGGDESEWRKRLTAALLNCPRLTIVDNVKRRLDSAQLAAALTAPLWQDRVLGRSEMKEVPVRTVWLVTGNNITMSDEIARRSVLIRLVPREERPHERRQFRHADLDEWTRERAGAILVASLIIVQSWNVRGRKPGSKTLGSFESWAGTMSGILENAKVPGFLENAATLYEVNDHASGEWAMFVSAWWERYGSTPVKCSALFDLAMESELLGDVLEGPGNGRIRLGKALQRRRDQVIAGYRLRDGGEDPRDRRLHFLEPVTTEPEWGRSGPNCGVDSGACTAKGTLGKSGNNRSAGVKTRPEGNPENLVQNTGEICDVDDTAATSVPDSGTPAPGESNAQNHLDTPPGVSVLIEVGRSSTPAFKLVTSVDQLSEVAQLIATARQVALDVETTGLDPLLHAPRLLQLAVNGGPVFVLDLFALGSLGDVAAALRGCEVIAHNAAFDLAFLQHHFGVEPASVRDPMIASKLLGGGLDLHSAGVHGLAGLCRRRLGIDLPKDLQASDWSQSVLTDDQYAYAARDVASLFALMDVLGREISNQRLDRAAQLEFEVLPALVGMRLNGIGVDSASLQELVGRLTAEMQAQRASLKSLRLGNPHSPVQVRAALRDRGIVVDETNAKLLAPFIAEPLVEILLAYRHTASLVKNTGNALMDACTVSPDRRLRADFDQLGTGTGRTVCRRPNLLGIPKHRDPGIRRCFVPAPGMVFIVADYSAIQLRALAQIADDAVLRQVFLDGGDPHRLTASQIFGKAVENVTKEERQKAKAVNFGFAFGMGAVAFVDYARGFGVNLTEGEAKRSLERYLSAYRGVSRWQEATKRCMPLEVRSASGRVRRFERSDRGYTERLAAPIQGTEADGLKRALILCHERLSRFGARLVLAVHDEIVVEAPIEQAKAARSSLEESMREGMAQFITEVPVEVESSVRKTWAEEEK